MVMEAQIFQSKGSEGQVILSFDKGSVIIAVKASRNAIGDATSLDPSETADFAQALLRGLDEPTKRSVIESVLR